MGKLEILLIIVAILWLASQLLFPPWTSRGRSAGPETFNFALWLAQGFGLGRIPVAPGTFGSVIGLLWFLLLAAGRSPWLLLGGALAGLAFSVWLCGLGEKILGRKDPGSVVMDEIAALPVCFFSWMGILLWNTGALPPPDYFFGAATWPVTVGVFAAFRFFDIIKPWPVRQSQALPGGWGVAVDDLLAALYVNLLALGVYWAGLLRF
jgi:phosphatidylglycerophosphatase A